MATYTAKKQKNPELKAKIALGFKTIINNDACVTAGRELKWFTPVILVLLSLVIALIPNLVNNLKVDYGSTIIGSAGYGVETGLTAFGDKLHTDNLDLTIKTGVFNDEQARWNAVFDHTVGTDTEVLHWYQHVNSVSEQYGESKKFDLEVFYNNIDGMSDVNFINTILANKNPYTENPRNNWNHDIIVPEEGQEATYSYNCSVVVFGKTTFFIQTFKNDGTAAFTAYYGAKYDRFADGFNMKSLFKNPTEVTSFSERRTFARTSMQSFVGTAFETFKISSTWQYTGIMAGVYAGMVVLLGVVLFLVTRGKKNPFRVITFWECQKIGYWSAFSPAVLALILGFILSGSIGQFLFIFLFGLRTMWLSMKSLRPM